MNKYLIIFLFSLLTACRGGDSPVNDNSDSGVGVEENGNEESAYAVPSTPHAYIPPVAVVGWQFMEPGLIVEVFDAPEFSQLDGAESALFVRYTTTDVQGNPALASGLVLFPDQQPFAEGDWPLVVYGHMTTGAADACAPSHISPDSTELQKMQQGDEIARRLLASGVVVARPDYEGIGEAGPHPYLRGDSLARSMRDMASAVATHWQDIGDRWVAAGHSEGGVAALNTGSRMHPEARGLTLVGVAAVTPVTQLENLVLIAESLPVTGPGINESVALAALVAHGIAAVDPAFKRLLLEEGGLSERALELWPDIERLCLADLSRAESWGGLPPDQAKGPKGDEALAELRRALAEDDVRHLPMRFDVPIRIDAGILDLVAHLPYTEQLVETYRNNGYSVTYGRWPAPHSPTADMAAPSIVSWIIQQFQD
ncbi:alpha/beta hydrolase [Zhongshania sp. BJYM1]|uniref:alpha/beta hydrolase n=1 Tax=Zhongshania aquatica TaxID=2965069 RepID=UPI0022B4E955|nr:lipase family protein [Marortus sp. BJYM1]